jgi:hypothetical protein
MNKTLLVASLLAMAGLSSVASAANDNWFIRGEAGQSRLTINGFTGSDSDTAASLRTGFFFTPNFAVEGFFTNYGNRDAGFGDQFKFHGWGVGVVGKKDFGPDNTGFFIDGRAGVVWNHTELQFAGGGSNTDNSSDPYFGVGAGYDFNRNFGLSLNWDYTRGNAFGASGHITTVTGGLEARF